jgi:hypothetical protein
VSVREYRERGYLPLALTSHLFRLGHSSAEHGLLTLDDGARFDPGTSGAPVALASSSWTCGRRTPCTS